MPAIQQEIHAVLFERDRVFALNGLDDLQSRDADLIPTGDARGACIGPNDTGDPHGGLLRDVHDGLEKLGGEIALKGHTLHEPVAIAHKQEDKLALMSAVVNPPLKGDFLTFGLSKLV